MRPGGEIGKHSYGETVVACKTSKEHTNLVISGLILTGIMLNTCVQSLLKAGVDNIGRFTFSVDNILSIGVKFATQWSIIGGLSCYVTSMVVWILGLSRVGVTIAHPMLSLSYVVNALLAWYLFGEVLSVQHLIGIAIVLAGVLVLVCP